MSEEHNSTDLSFLKIDRNAAPPPNGRRNVILLSAVALLVVVIAGYLFFGSSSSAEQVETGAAVMTAPGQEQALLTASGYVVAQRKAAVASKGTGRLIFLGVIEGDRVTKGEIIGRLESNDVEALLGQARASLKVAKAGLETAQAELDDAKNNFDRQNALYQQGSISKAEYDAANARHRRAVAGVTSAEANIKFAEANVRSAEVGVENTLIRAPFDGVVLTKEANVGEVISPFGAAAGSRGAIVTVADMSSLEVEADVSESNIQRIKEGQPCMITLDAYPGVQYRGYVNKVVPTADRAKATVLTKIRFDRLDGHVLPEMRAKVSFLSAGKNKDEQPLPPVLTLPSSSVVTRNGRPVVFVIMDGTVAETEVVTGTTYGSRVEVRSGVRAGDRVVLHPSDGLTSGSKVSVKE